MKYEEIAEFRLYDLDELKEASKWKTATTVLVSALRQRQGGTHPTPVAFCPSLSEAHRMVEEWLRDADRHSIVSAKKEDEWEDYGVYCSEYMMDKFPFIRDDDFTSTSEMIGAFDIVYFKDGIVLGRDYDHLAICIHDL